METMTLTLDIQDMIIDLARQLHLSEMDILRRAIEDYARKIRRKQRLMAFAGILTDTEADDLLRAIQSSRVNKTEFVEL